MRGATAACAAQPPPLASAGIPDLHQFVFFGLGAVLQGIVSRVVG
jgi:hypothetical protein